MSELIPIPSPGIPLFWGEPGNPLVVVVHDWYGRLPALEVYAEALASQGLRVAVPDLFNGVATIDEDTAAELMSALDLGVALAELDDIIVNAHDEGSERVAVVGFSMGGWLTLLHAQGGAADAIVVYYASLAPKDHGVIPSPVLLHYAEHDEWAPGEEPDAFIERLREHGTPVTDHRYPGTSHSFANATLADKVDPQAAELAFAYTATFLTKHLLG